MAKTTSLTTTDLFDGFSKLFFFVKTKKVESIIIIKILHYSEIIVLFACKSISSYAKFKQIIKSEKDVRLETCLKKRA